MYPFVTLALRRIQKNRLHEIESGVTSFDLDGKTFSAVEVSTCLVRALNDNEIQAALLDELANRGIRLRGLPLLQWLIDNWETVLKIILTIIELIG